MIDFTLDDIKHHYKKMKDKILKDIDVNKKCDLIFDSKHADVDIYQNKKRILRCEYQILGTYNITSSLWIWSNILFVETHLMKDILTLRKTMNLKNNYTSDVMLNELFIYYFTHDTFILTDPSILIKILLYLTKSIWIFSEYKKDGIIEYISIKHVNYVN